MKKTISNESELRGIINTFIYLFDLHQHSIKYEFGLGFQILKIEKTYNVKFAWQGKEKNVVPADYESEKICDFEECEDSIMILEDASFDQIEQLVTDSLNIVIQTQL